ncbi:MAG: hypothetical protein HZA01_17095 [Nitrospinae bacterium]|nr:hypothetical protein [Nitrospinota bacterium]
MSIDIESMIMTVLIFIAALLYSSVGHAGASGYIAAMALTGLSPAVMKPAALALNILVAFIATFKFYRVGAFSWDLFWPLALASIPCADRGASYIAYPYIQTNYWACAHYGSANAARCLLLWSWGRIGACFEL